MRTEKEIRFKIDELKDEFFDNDEEYNRFTLRDLKRKIKVLNWVLGKSWKEDKVPARHGGKGKKELLKVIGEEK